MSYLDDQKAQAASYRFRQHLFKANRLAAYNAANLSDPKEISRRQALEVAYKESHKAFRMSKTARQFQLCQTETGNNRLCAQMIANNLKGKLA